MLVEKLPAALCIAPALSPPSNTHPPTVPGSPQLLPLYACLQVYLAKWRETIVAVKVFLVKAHDNEPSAPAAQLSLSHPVLDNLRRVRQGQGQAPYQASAPARK